MLVVRLTLVLHICMSSGLLGSFHCSDMSLLSVPPGLTGWGFQILVMVHLTVLKIFWTSLSCGLSEWTIKDLPA